MAYPYSTPMPMCRLVTPYECACGNLDLDPSLGAERINYEHDRHILGADLAGELQIAREHALADIAYAVEASEGYWERMLSGSSPRLREIGGAS